MVCLCWRRRRKRFHFFFVAVAVAVSCNKKNEKSIKLGSTQNKAKQNKPNQNEKKKQTHTKVMSSSSSSFSLTSSSSASSHSALSAPTRIPSEMLNLIECCNRGELRALPLAFARCAPFIVKSHVEFILKNVCSIGHLHVLQWFLLKFEFTLPVMHDLFRHACCHGHLTMARFLFFIEPRIGSMYPLHAEQLVQRVCHHGHLCIVRWLLSRVFPSVNLSADNEHAFCSACANGFWELAQWLKTVKPNISTTVMNHFALRWAIARRHDRVVQFLRSFPMAMEVL